MAYTIDLSGRVAFITGASGGLGAQFAKTLTQAGATVVLASRRMDRLKDLRAELESQGFQAHVVQLDVSSTSSISRAIEHAEREVGPIDILINNSGVSTTQKIQDAKPEDFDFVFNTNVRGAFFTAQEVGKRMLGRAMGVEKGSFPGARIINIASVAGLRVLPQLGLYAPSNAAVIQLTTPLALDWARFGINVHAICTG